MVDTADVTAPPVVGFGKCVLVGVGEAELFVEEVADVAIAGVGWHVVGLRR